MSQRAASASRPLSFEDIPKALDSVERALTAPDALLEAQQELFIPVHGFINLTPAEMRILDHPALQRLGRIQALGHSSLVYRGATHTRLEHVLGVVHVAQAIIDALDDNCARARSTEAKAGTAVWGEGLTVRERVFIRLAALLHDIGHLPYGHTLEDELAMFGRHDRPERLTLLMDRADWPGPEVSSLRRLIDDIYDPAVDEGVRPSELIMQLVAPDEDNPPSPQVKNAVRLDICRDIVGNTICADLLDYLHRDWYHIGKHRYYDTRIFQYMELRHEPDKEQADFVIYLGRSPKIRSDAVSAIQRLLTLRYELFESVLYHRTKCAAAAMLERGIQELERAREASPPDAGDTNDGEDAPNVETKRLKVLLDTNDAGAIAYFLAQSRRLDCAPAESVLGLLRERILYTDLTTKFRRDVPHDFERLQGLYNASPEAAENRRRAMALLEKDFDLPPACLALYCPHRAMQAKVADVNICVDGRISRLERYEENHKDALTGGELTAQRDRFRDLWRVHVFMDSHLYEQLREDNPEKLTILRQAIHTLVLGLAPVEEEEDELRSLARLAQRTPGMPVFEQKLVTGWRKDAPGGDKYPSGLASLSSLFSA